MLSFKSKLMLDSITKSTQRKSITKKVLSTIFAIFVAIIASTILVGILNYDTNDFLYRLFTQWKLSLEIYLTKVAVIGIAALSFIFAFKAGIFNIGISGQMLGAGMIMLVVVKNMDLAQINMPNWAGQLFLLVIALVSGAMFALLIGLLKVFLKINEVLSAILLNWIIFFVTRYVVFTAQNKIYNPNPNQIGQSSIQFSDNYSLTKLGSFEGVGVGGESTTFTYGFIFALLIFISLSVIVFIILKYTVFGHKILSVGKSFSAAQYAGYKTKLISLSTFAISGALAGALAMVNYTATSSNAITISQSNDILPLQGFDGIAIGLIAQTHPLATIPVSFLMGLLQQSTENLGGSFPQDISGIIISFVMLGAAMFVLFERISPVYWAYQLFSSYKAKDLYKEYENVSAATLAEYKALYNENKKNLNLYHQKLKKLYQQLKQHPNHINYHLAEQTYQKALVAVNQFYKDQLAKYYEEYLNKTTYQLAQFKKHILIEEAKLVYYPEIEAQRKFNAHLKRIENKSALHLSKYKDKIYAEQALLQKLQDQHLSQYVMNLDVNYEAFKQFKAEFDQKPVWDLNNTKAFLATLKDKDNRLIIDHIDALETNDEIALIATNNQLNQYVNKILDQEVEEIISLNKINKKDHNPEFTNTIEQYFAKKDRVYNQILNKRNKCRSAYINELDKFANETNNVDSLLKKYQKQPSLNKIEAFYKKATIRANKLKLNENEKNLINEWLLAAKTNQLNKLNPVSKEFN
ncbi:ABC transporter permease subunit [Ureaplasma diversum]|uniref:ABC transporter permease subunit n=1 Tax=Ureaplasma diversum TaxID=42094 RepID=UPI000A5538C3|nr:ABC transporter permease [Ureaplasma diversum]